MTTKLLLASLLAVSCATADANTHAKPGPAAGPAKAAATCAASGPILFQAVTKPREGVEIGGQTLPVTTLYANGAWTYAETLDGAKPAHTASGCLSSAQLKTIEADLEASPWTIKHDQIHCMAIASTYVEYSVRGAHVFTQMMCGSDSLDPESQKHLAEIDGILADARKPARPPCCKK